MSGGLYVLVVRVDGDTPMECEIGALGRRRFDPGDYGYVGSANGPGGFARVARHLEMATGERDTCHWHIDYLLAAPRVTIDTTVRLPDRSAECALAEALPGRPVSGFGASDCGCGAHLFRLPDRSSVRTAIDQFREDSSTTGTR